MVDKHGVRPDPDAVEAVLIWNITKTDTQMMSFLGFANFLSSVQKRIQSLPKQQLMRKKGKKFEDAWWVVVERSD